MENGRRPTPDPACRVAAAERLLPIFYREHRQGMAWRGTGRQADLEKPQLSATERCCVVRVGTLTRSLITRSSGGQAG